MVQQMRKNMSGYLVGLIISTVATVLVIAGAIIYLRAMLISAAMRLGSDDSPLPILLLMLGGYLLIAAVVAIVTNRIYNSRTGVAFLINVAPLVVIVSLLFLWKGYRDYANARSRNRSLETAISDAPAIHLSEPYVKMVDNPNGGVIFFLHVPVTVDRTIRAHSLNILVTSNESSLDIRYSSDPECNSGYGKPSYGFHVVDREYTESPLPIYHSGRKIVSEQLQPGTQYYLLRELHLGNSQCRVSDYEDFDPKQIRVTLDPTWAMQDLEQR